MMPRSCAMLYEGQRSQGNIAQLRGIIFQRWSRLTVNICFVISWNKYNKFLSTSMMQQHRIRIDPLNIAVGPKNWRKCMVWRRWCHFDWKHGARDAMFPGTWRCTDKTGQHCLFLHITRRALDQSRSCNSDRDITIIVVIHLSLIHQLINCSRRISCGYSISGM